MSWTEAAWDHYKAHLKFRVAAGLLVAWIFSAVFTYDEFRYLVGSERTDATITSISQVARGRRATGPTHLAVNYKFDHEGKPHTGSVYVPLDWTPPPTGLLPIQYFPGENVRSRIAGDVNWWALLFFFGTLAPLVASAAFITADYYKEQARDAARAAARARGYR